MCVCIPFVITFLNWAIQNPLRALYENEKFSRNVFLASSIILVILAGLAIPSTIIESSSSNYFYIDGNARDTLRNKRPRFFFEMGIKKGSVIELRGNDKNIFASATVVDEHKVSYENGEPCSLNDLTKKLLGVDYDVHPMFFWTYKGKWLHDIYNDTYPKNN